MKISSVMSKDVQLTKHDSQCGGFDEEDRCWPTAGD
jgi:hypothetical protein